VRRPLTIWKLWPGLRKMLVSPEWGSRGFSAAIWAQCSRVRVVVVPAAMIRLPSASAVFMASAVAAGSV